MFRRSNDVWETGTGSQKRKYKLAMREWYTQLFSGQKKQDVIQKTALFKAKIRGSSFVVQNTKK